MSSGISLSGLGSGLPIDSWISQLVQVKQKDIDALTTEQSTLTAKNSALSQVKSSYSSLLSSLQTITDSKYGSSFDLFAKNASSSSNSNVVTATVTSSAAKQSLRVTVSQLATATTVQSTSASPVAADIDSNTKFSTLADGAAVTGSLSVYVDGTKHSITIGKDDTIGTILNNISTETGLTAAVKDGKISISSDTPKNIVIGSNSDTSNFASVTALVKNTDGSYGSSKEIFKVSTSAALTSADAGFATQIKTGSFKIGDDTFTIDSNTTLTGLLSEINSSDKANVNAYWDSNAGKMVITSKEEGAYNVNIENLSGNFTDVIGLTTSTYNEDGSVKSSSLVTGSQTLGNVAKLTINDTPIISSSNTVTSDISGLAGVTLSLKGLSTTDTTSGKLATSTVSVTADTSSLVSALNTFVSNFNTAISNSDTATGSDGYLYGESTLTMIRNDLRTTSTDKVGTTGTGNYKSLADIGITTGAIGTSLDANTNQLVVDTTKLSAALAANPDQVKKLLLGDGTTDGKGVLQKLSDSVSGALDSTNGYFATRAQTFSTQSSDLSDKISKQTDALSDYKTSLTKKFSDMDAMIASLNQQLSSFKSALGIS